MSTLPKSPDTATYWPDWPHTPTPAEVEEFFAEPVASKESLRYRRTADKIFIRKMPGGYGYPWCVEMAARPWRCLPRPQRFATWREAMNYADGLRP